MSDKKKKKKKPESLNHFGSTMGILPFVRKNNKNASEAEIKDMIESFQNDRTKGLPKEAYEQEDQELRYEAPIEKMNMGGECRGSKAIRGKKFTGVF
jgi:hypothetical protein